MDPWNGFCFVLKTFRHFEYDKIWEKKLTLIGIISRNSINKNTTTIYTDFDNENESNKCCKVFFSKSCNIADQCTSINSHKDKENNSNPNANP